ncbi:MAG: FGGY-family carbohydrate kinase [Anaerolineales bacterium]|nr:FGGY-family carbohydrate kinase [Anaerolineales bacterium]
MTAEDKARNAYVLAIDLGSGGPKVGLVDQEGRLAASAVRSTPVAFLEGGGAEQDPHEWWAASMGAARQVIREAGVPRQSIKAVACTSQFSVITPVDENGQALMNALHWMDTRGAPYNRALVGGFPTIQGYNLGKLLKWVRRVGMPPILSGADALGHILFIKNERPDIYRKTHKFLEPADYLNLRLTGKCAATLNTVLPYMLADNRRLDGTDYDAELLRIAGIDRAKLPDILPIDGIVGTITPSVAEELGLSPDTVVTTAANDNSTSAIGSGAVADFDSVAVLGTSGYLACHLPFKKTDLQLFITTMPSALPGRYLIFAELGNNGKVLDSYLNNFVYPQDEFGQVGPPPDLYQRLDTLAEQSPPGSQGVLFLPWFNGCLSPSEDSYVRGGFLNLSNRTTRAHMTRAVLEGIALNWRWLLGAVEKFSGRKIERLRLGGGGALSSAWAQIMADVTGLPMQQLANPRFGNVLGIAFLAFNRLGLLPLEQMPLKVQIAKVYEPRQEYRSLYDERFTHFLASLNKLRPVFHALNR